jgi:hypothetical protein
MVRRIRSLLYEQGFTIGGARQRLKDGLKSTVVGEAPRRTPVPPLRAANEAVTSGNRAGEIRALRSELEDLLKLLPE